MAPRLYTASVVGEGVPVDEVEQKVKKPRQKKEKPVELPTIPEDGASRGGIKPSHDEVPAEVKEKKPRTEKQIAAAERMVEARRLKKEQKEREAAEAAAKVEEEKKKIADKEAAKEAKKEAAKEKRRQSKLLKATKSDVTSGDENTVEPPQIKEKPQKRKVDDDAPPKWLPTLISAIKSETGHTGSAKKLKEESHAEAVEKWSDPLVRDRVNVIHNKAGEQVTNAIFPGRTFIRR